MIKQTIAFLGAGSMAEAMISGMVESGNIPAEKIIVTNRSNQERLNKINEKYGVRTVLKDDLNFAEVDQLILAMKPKDIDGVLAELKDQLTPNQVLVSVLAGISTSYMEDRLNDGQQVIRVMPNTSSMLRESATAITPGRYTDMDNVRVAKELLQSIGEVFVIEEDKMDVFTGIAGSGPAYFYYLMEHIEETGRAEGMDRETLREIGAQTLLGAAKMMLEREESPTELRENVTSPNGTTAAGLHALDEAGGGYAISEAIKGAASRSKELSKELEGLLVGSK
ncbi:pyrroline-5-carboxylate reductase [Halobacillus karajensis]|uniref:Pyrroline-5-carboxylate reductase n=1 Tax=Halobacillus karajensis TaxID=195088 RepID=A0A024P4P0_9BACI|nr:pyrroline-5-carboxylate reductase [Halobacillus karajensis]CDQ20507.1 Pyrroline-5-carboxylate reductase [Halobacillus karajensis]CDQ24024.1 Pyrroline-5-carboxylate reductase [Halobacillus karajensis]CDQ27502.1 Pyrroline-5-carboxylate reductase [Halobacillus karajensis]SEH90707.1 pyrroline-5-carboxylate reductase [Halobacillus karajensis]